jgi:transcriptional regulator with GAF, ATPase, and Fis domain
MTQPGVSTPGTIHPRRSALKGREITTRWTRVVTVFGLAPFQGGWSWGGGTRVETAAGRFRDDLYYRLNVFPLKVAALRERKKDIPLLATHFIELLVNEFGCPKPRLTRAGLGTLRCYDWPGNIRELRNVIERAVIFARGGALEFDVPGTACSVDLTSLGPRNVDQAEPEYLTEAEMRRRERENIFAVLRKASWKIKGLDGAAEPLGVKPTTLSSRIEKMGLKRPA